MNLKRAVEMRINQSAQSVKVGVSKVMSGGVSFADMRHTEEEINDVAKVLVMRGLSTDQINRFIVRLKYRQRLIDLLENAEEDVALGLDGYGMFALPMDDYYTGRLYGDVKVSGMYPQEFMLEAKRDLEEMKKRRVDDAMRFFDKYGPEMYSRPWMNGNPSRVKRDE